MGCKCYTDEDKVQKCSWLWISYYLFKVGCDFEAHNKMINDVFARFRQDDVSTIFWNIWNIYGPTERYSTNKAIEISHSMFLFTYIFETNPHNRSVKSMHSVHHVTLDFDFGFGFGFGFCFGFGFHLASVNKDVYVKHSIRVKSKNAINF